MTTDDSVVKKDNTHMTQVTITDHIIDGDAEKLDKVSLTQRIICCFGMRKNIKFVTKRKVGQEPKCH